MLEPTSLARTRQRSLVEDRVSVKSVRQLIASKTHIDLDLFFRSPSPGLRSTVTKRPLLSFPASPTSEARAEVRLPPIPSSKSPSPQRSQPLFDKYDSRVVNRSKDPKIKQIIKAMRNVQTYLPPLKSSNADSPTKAMSGLQPDNHHKRYRSLAQRTKQH
jgi:hypothetical protein